MRDNFTPGKGTLAFALLAAFLTIKPTQKRAVDVLFGILKEILLSLPHSLRISVVRHILGQIGRRGQIMMDLSTAPHGSQWDWITPIESSEANVKGYWIDQSVQMHADRQEFIRATASKTDLTILYIHGGGFRMGTSLMYTETYIRLLQTLKNSFGVNARVCTMDYRFAPEWNVGQMLDAVLEVYKHLLSSGVQPSKLIIGGDSAGGYLTAMALSRIRDMQMPTPLGAIIVSPLVTYLTDSSSFAKHKAFDCIPDNLARQNFKELFPQLEFTSEEESTTYLRSVFPLYSDTTSFPPVLVTYGKRERFSDHIEAFIHSLKQADIQVEVIAKDNEPHVFNVTPFLASSKRVWADQVDQMAGWCAKRLEEQ
ncbi:alpha/beta-hydrolase [Hesseltinella vesiculosa]|uniref:Alpha/beta-hydrolase n=1 Tax=Hesseltinella vesiculosa TaxID=101127 RepID=A0A1X2GLT2_9FUNG|nr:alpha/beta-hydrolase [Hesseltinella vesiculosa]